MAPLFVKEVFLSVKALAILVFLLGVTWWFLRSLPLLAVLVLSYVLAALFFQRRWRTMIIQYNQKNGAFHPTEKDWIGCWVALMDGKIVGCVGTTRTFTDMKDHLKKQQQNNKGNAAGVDAAAANAAANSTATTTAPMSAAAASSDDESKVAGLYRLSCDVPYRRHGIASKLLRFAEERTVAEGFRRIDIIVGNADSLKFWLRNGYSIVQVKWRFFDHESYHMKKSF